MAPPNAMNVEGSDEAFTVTFKRIGGKGIRLVGVGRDYGDFGERIGNTLTGDLDIYEGDQLIASAKGSAGLERRSAFVRTNPS